MHRTVAALLLGLALVAGCSAKVEQGTAKPVGGDKPPVAKFTTAPPDGAADAPVNQPVQVTVAEGAIGATSLENLVERLEPPRVAWIMVPSGAVTESGIAKNAR